jgi:hypothetical protein
LKKSCITKLRQQKGVEKKSFLLRQNSYLNWKKLV